MDLRLICPERIEEPPPVQKHKRPRVQPAITDFYLPREEQRRFQDLLRQIEGCKHRPTPRRVPITVTVSPTDRVLFDPMQLGDAPVSINPQFTDPEYEFDCYRSFLSRWKEFSLEKRMYQLPDDYLPPPPPPPS